MSARRPCRDLPDTPDRPGVVDADAGRRMPPIDLEPLDVVVETDTVVFDGPGDGERLRSDDYEFLDTVR